MFLIFDTETTGLPRNYKAPISDSDNWPRLVQLAWQLHDSQGTFLDAGNLLVQPDGFTIPYGVSELHGITTEKALADGKPLANVLQQFCDALDQSKVVVGHNVEFDLNIIGAEFFRLGMEKDFSKQTILDTKECATEFCALPGGKSGKFKWPSLKELYQKLFGTSFSDAHNAAYDVEATTRCFFELLRLKVIAYQAAKLTKEEFNLFLEKNPDVVQAVGIEAEKFVATKVDEESVSRLEHTLEESIEKPSEKPFTHLHVHTQYSRLDGAASINGLIKKAKKDGMNALAITDHGTMSGAKQFYNYAKAEGIKPILGCEVYMARKHRSIKEEQSSYHLILLAKNLTGYYNLTKLVSYAYLEGYYYKPRIDRELLQKYHEGLICCSACLGGELPQAIMFESEEKADEVIDFFKNLFRDDYYIEIQRHKTENPEKNTETYRDQMLVNRRLISLAKKHQVKLIATNDIHFVDKEDDPAHDRLLCIGTAKDLDDPNRMKYTGEEYFKTREEMWELFSDVAEALVNTQEIVDKIEHYALNRKPIMPVFSIPKSFGTIEQYRKKYPDDNSLKTLFSEKGYAELNDYEKALSILFETEYLRYEVYEGAKKRYEIITPEIKERIDFEIATIQNMGFPSYFLIIWDLLNVAREMDVVVGPGRGSAAGSVVAYCLKITDIDPLKYNLLFERFLNPDRISMPDIDIDFDDEGRKKVLNWVVEKYGKARVAHIITFGRMAAKSAIRDVARVQKLDLRESDRLAKMVPERPGTTLNDAFFEIPELKFELENGTQEVKSVLENARKLEGAIRNIGVHACGVIIGRDNLENYIPITTTSDSELTYVTQYDGKHVEDIGLLKMDFLGLKTLTIIKSAVENIRLTKGININIDEIPLDDKATYELYSRGDTTGLFQFESDGMKKSLRELKPTVFGDLIAMNALYRPGPMKYIPLFINRKHGLEEISYLLPEMEEYLSDTYGITVYQEQVMLLARKLANLTRGESDSLRKAMGKKNIAEMNKLKEKYFSGCEKNGHKREIAEKIWADWEAFAEYAFNKSHATCYSYVSYQTAYLKTHHPSEYMAAVLSHNLNDIKKLIFFIDECNRMGIKVLGPSVNESRGNFFVNQKGEIRFGLNGIKGVGEGPTEEILRERTENGAFNDIFDFVTRVSLRVVNKKSLESLAKSGAFDCFENMHRAQFFHVETLSDTSFLEKLIRYSNNIEDQKKSAQMSLFDDIVSVDSAPLINPPKCEQWHLMEILQYEKELTGFYISGHPLQQYADEIRFFTNITIGNLAENMKCHIGKTLQFAGIVSAAQHRVGKSGKPFGNIVIDDADGSIQLSFFSENYLKYKHLMIVDKALFVVAKVDRRMGTEELEIRPQSLMLLDEVIQEMAHSIQIDCLLHEITPKFIKKSTSIVKQCKGKNTLIIKILDPAQNMFILLKSGKKINIHDFVSAFKSEWTNNYTILKK